MVLWMSSFKSNINNAEETAPVDQIAVRGQSCKTNKKNPSSRWVKCRGGGFNTTKWEKGEEVNKYLD